jgi:hypothetical protein
MGGHTQLPRGFGRAPHRRPVARARRWRVVSALDHGVDVVLEHHQLGVEVAAGAITRANSDHHVALRREGVHHLQRRRLRAQVHHRYQ